MATTNVEIRPEMQVNEVIRLFPGTVAVFHRVGIDSCCGGALPVAEAARRHGLELAALLDELAAAADASS